MCGISGRYYKMRNSYNILSAMLESKSTRRWEGQFETQYNILSLYIFKFSHACHMRCPLSPP